MNFYASGASAPEGSTERKTYYWIEDLHDVLDHLYAAWAPPGWPHNYSTRSATWLERDLVDFCAKDQPGDLKAIFTDRVAAYWGEVLLNEVGGRWLWDEDPETGVGLPVVLPDPALDMAPIFPLALAYEALEAGTGRVFTGMVRRVRKIVRAKQAQEPHWTPDRVPTPRVRRWDLEARRQLMNHRNWYYDCKADFRAWWTADADTDAPDHQEPSSEATDRIEALIARRSSTVEGFRPRPADKTGWDFSPESLDRLEAVLRKRCATVEEFNEVCAERFWIVAAWYVGEVVNRHKDADWQYRAVQPDALPGSMYAEDNYWTGSVFVRQRNRFGGHAEHPSTMLRSVLEEGITLREAFERFPS